MSLIDTVKADLVASKLSFDGVHVTPKDGKLLVNVQFLVTLPSEVEAILEKVMDLLGMGKSLV